eukprot:9460813-Lingulodinium_polyedra.AAC.1
MPRQQPRQCSAPPKARLRGRLLQKPGPPRPLAPSPMGKIGIGFGNITMFSEKAKDYIKQAAWLQVFCVVEHHLAAGKLKKATREMARSGWASQLAAARLSGRSAAGTSGGAGVFWRPHLAVKGQSRQRPRGPAEKFTGHDWSAVVLKVRRAPLVVMALYFTHGVGCSG